MKNTQSNVDVLVKKVELEEKQIRKICTENNQQLKAFDYIKAYQEIPICVQEIWMSFKSMLSNLDFEQEFGQIDFGNMSFNYPLKECYYSIYKFYRQELIWQLQQQFYQDLIDQNLTITCEERQYFISGNEEGTIMKPVVIPSVVIAKQKIYKQK